MIEVPGSFDGGEEIGEEAYMPDAHHIYAAPEQNFEEGSPPPLESAARGGRIRRRGGRARGRGRVGPRQPSSRGTAGLRAASTSEHSWATGDTLVHVCITDDDVPGPLRDMVRQLVQSRQARDTATAARQARRQERQQRLQQDDGNEEFFDADDDRDAVLLEGGNNFDWRPMDTFTPNREIFTPDHTGSVERHTTIYDAFRSYWDECILGEIVTETNRYAANITVPVFRRHWFDTNIHEILVLFSFWMMLGIIKMPTIKSCFSTNPLLSTDIFRRMFSQRRYTALVRALHFANNDARPENASRLYCFGNILEHMNQKFANSYVPGPNISIDESLTLWKGVLLFRQYIRTKAARFGIKTFELCDSVTGYLWSFIVYTGKDPNARAARHSALLKSTSVVLELVQPLLHKGYRLFMDNWFNSPTLARYLKTNGTDCVGTLRSSRCGVPPLIQQANLQKGQVIARHSGDMCVMAWQDKKKIMTISTCHDATAEQISNGRFTQWKPKVILDYNKYMGGVDRKDQMLEPYLLERKRCKKWYLKLFKRLLNASILNARILLESSSGSSQDHLACRLRLIQQIMEKHLHLTPVQHTPQNPNTLARLDTRQVHWPVRVTQSNARSDEGRHTRMRCVLCLQMGIKNKRTTYKCEHCNAPLCIDTCFKPYHNV